MTVESNHAIALVLVLLGLLIGCTKGQCIGIVLTS